MNQQTPQDKAGVIIFPPLLYLLVLVTGIIISYFFPYHFIDFSIALPIGIIITFLGIASLILAAKLFRKNKNPVNPSGSTQLIICTGIYKYTRNPMYLGLTTIFIGISTITNAWFSFILLFPLLMICQKGIIEREESYLARKFGNEYLDYQSKVRRWIGYK
jgi:protein-S-isoprenylcysteine O-methyltransferase Ste14